MRRGQESPWLKFMENKGRSLLEWSENYPVGQLTIWGQTGNAPILTSVNWIFHINFFWIFFTDKQQGQSLFPLSLAWYGFWALLSSWHEYASKRFGPFQKIQTLSDLTTIHVLGCVHTYIHKPSWSIEQFVKIDDKVSPDISYKIQAASTG